MAIKGRNIFVKDLSLDGALVIDSIDEAEVCLENEIMCSLLYFSNMNILTG